MENEEKSYPCHSNYSDQNHQTEVGANKQLGNSTSKGCGI